MLKLTMGERACNQCIAHTKSGNRCSKTTCKVGPWCWIHLKYQRGLQVKPSTIPGAGLGVFATKPFKANEVIDKYTGEKLNEAQKNASTSAYIADGPKGIYFDARKTNSCPSRYINAPRRTKKRANCKWGRITSDGVNVTTKRKIKPGEELLIGYGSRYWR